MTPKISEKTVCVASEYVVVREIEGDMIIIPLVGGIGNADDELYTLNETGCAVMRHLDGVKTLHQVVTMLAEQYAKPENEILADALDFCEEMVERKILVIKD